MQRLENRLEREQILGAVIDDENVDLLRRHRRHWLARRRSVAVRRRAAPAHAPPGGTARGGAPARGPKAVRALFSRSLIASASISASAAAIPAMLSTRASGTQRIAAVGIADISAVLGFWTSVRPPRSKMRRSPRDPSSL